MAAADRAHDAAAPAPSTDPLISLADQCVQCGLCLPHCPTYAVARSEADSPRGRIAFARALAEGRLADDSSAGAHLDRCLGCRTCERVCPSQVRYGDILQLARERRPAHAPSLRRLLPLLARPWRLRALARLAHITRAPRWLPRLAARLAPRAGITHWLRELPELPEAPPRSRQSSAPSIVRRSDRGRIALLGGCVASAYDRDTLAAAECLLRALGYDVTIPPRQGCCGAIAYHAGRVDVAQTLAAPTRRALLAAQPDAVLVTASGCWESTRRLLSATPAIAVHDALRFIAQDDALATLRFRARKQTAALHLPCTQQGIDGSVAGTRRLLGLVPQLKLVALDRSPRCCGASGSYFLDHSDLADPLRAAKLDDIAAAAPDLVVSANIGCRLFLDNGLRHRGSPLRVLHPLSLLAQQLE